MRVEAAASEVDLSIVAPAHNEADSLDLLVARVTEVAKRLQLSSELVVVDDASDDGSGSILREHEAAGRLRWVRLARNSGQLAATRRGLGEAKGTFVAVMDADLQHPPEVLPALLEALRSAGPSCDGAFGVSQSASAGRVFLALQTAYYMAQNTLTRSEVPARATSFCVLRRRAAKQIAELDIADGNVGSALSFLGGRAITLEYEKARREGGDSRLALSGHLREATGALRLRLGFPLRAAKP